MPETIEILPRDGARFPESLLTLVNGPNVLYVRGRADALFARPAVAVVGTRKMTRYGEQVTRGFVGTWAARGVTIVSGLALGVDAVAHAAALDAGGTTVAVLGSGVDDPSIAPRTNYRLAHRIIESEGALVSEYEPETPPYPANFRARNRIVAGLADATVVIEGSMRSGTLITAKFALECGRDVFAVPGPVNCETSRGPNWLISQGACPLLDPQELLDRFGIPPEVDRPDPTDGDEAAVLSALRDSPAAPDELCRRTGLSASRVLETLSDLELEGRIVRSGDMFSPARN